MGYSLSFFHWWVFKGLIPIAFHIDGAEFYSNSEFYVWSIGSTFPTGDVSRNNSIVLDFDHKMYQFKTKSEQFKPIEDGSLYPL